MWLINGRDFMQILSTTSFLMIFFSYNAWQKTKQTLKTFCVSPPHCCRATVSCPPPWCGVVETGTGGCPWWYPCGWSSLCRRAPSSGERWETAHFQLRNMKNNTHGSKTWLRLLVFLSSYFINTITDTDAKNDQYIQQHSGDWGLVVRKQQERFWFLNQSVQSWLVDQFSGFSGLRLD